MKSINEFIAASAVIIFPASVLVVDKVYGAVFLIVILLGIWQMVAYRKEIFPISKDEKLFFLSLCFVMVTVVITTVVNDTDMDRADRFLALILAIPAYIFFKRNFSKEKYVWFGLIAGTFIASGVAVYQVFGLSYCSIKPVRATGLVHPIIFGDLALLMGAMSLAGIGWFKKHSIWLVSFPVFSFIAGMVASALSLSRGGWVALPFLVILFIWYSSNKTTLVTKIMSYSLLIVITGSLYFIPQTGVQKRLDTSISNFDRYFDDKIDKDWEKYTSIGGRLEMWKAAWIIFLDNPVVGGGWGDYSEKAQKLVDKGVLNKSAAKYYHPHNQFFSALAKGGVIGFISILILFLFPAIIFYKFIRNKAKPEIQRLVLAGLIFIVCFVSFSLTEAILERSRSIIFFSFYLAIIMSQVQHCRKNNYSF